MREIKFRAWWLPETEEECDDEKYRFKGKMIYNIKSIHFSDENYIMGNGKRKGISFYEPSVLGFVGSIRNIPPEEYILMQYTGLKDKNGKDIYEGDILKTESELVLISENKKTGKISIYLSEVIWMDDCWGYKVIKNIQNFQGTLNVEWSGLVTHAKYSEVIGSIHENLEILDDTK